MIKKILVANRGEIAVRVMRSCREMEITSIAIFSEADRTAKHVLYADEAYCVGPAASKESYLNIEKIIEVAKAAHADAIHQVTALDLHCGFAMLGVGGVWRAGGADFQFNLLSSAFAHRKQWKLWEIKLLPVSK